jgi:hypothetical protein
MVGAYCEQPLAQKDIAGWLHTRLVGTPAGRIARLARRGFDVLFTMGAPATLVEWLNQGVPPILLFRTGDLQPHVTVDTPHALVLAGIEGDNCVLFDPGLDVASGTVLLGNLLLAGLHIDDAYKILCPLR